MKEESRKYLCRVVQNYIDEAAVEELREFLEKEEHAEEEWGVFWQAIYNLDKLVGLKEKLKCEGERET